jgi:alkylation response protein AidB-like acyl-CoA dehydrogenase
VDFEPNEDQTSILDGLEQLIASLDTTPPLHGEIASWSQLLDDTVAEAGFLGIAREEGFGLLDAALIVERLARLGISCEAAASAIVAPGLIEDPALRPVALASSITAAARFLPMARALLVDQGEDALLVEVDPQAVEPVETLFAYPYGRLKDAGSLPSTRLAGQGPLLRRRWRIAIAVESAGLMLSALDTVVEHVKSRMAFGRPLGSFQAIQHRLVMTAEQAHATLWLSRQAAWRDTDSDAAIACAYAQEAVTKVAYDLHQFSGAMGLTTEFPLHFWTYRLRALQGELGGSSIQARAAVAPERANALT